jgi:hypothetical protein
MITLNCTCQKGFHILDYRPEDEAMLADTIKQFGQFKKITIVGGKSWKVPIAFILVHGIKADLMETYGFEEWPEDATVESCKSIPTPSSSFSSES